MVTRLGDARCITRGEVKFPYERSSSGLQLRRTQVDVGDQLHPLRPFIRAGPVGYAAPTLQLIERAFDQMLYGEQATRRL
jgi:hypothetical protein